MFVWTILATLILLANRMPVLDRAHGGIRWRETFDPLNEPRQQTGPV